MEFAPLVTVFVRHAADCRYQGDEFASGATAASICAGHKTESNIGARRALGHGLKLKSKSGDLRTNWPGAFPQLRCKMRGSR
jgi:hypothetical protein